MCEAIVARDPNLCASDRCILTVATYNNDMDMCELLDEETPTYNRDNCIMWIAANLEDISACELVSEPGLCQYYIESGSSADSTFNVHR